jgi:hypothetical protein
MNKDNSSIKIKDIFYNGVFSNNTFIDYAIDENKLNKKNNI